MKLLPLFSWLLFSCAAFGEDITIPALVTGDNVNLRTGPSRHADIVGQLERGMTVRVVLTDGEWSAIVPPPGTAAWVSRRFLQDGVVIGDRVNLRAGPSVAYATLIKLEAGEEVAVIEEEEEWAKIELPETARLWVNARYLSAGSEPALPDSASIGSGEKIILNPFLPAVEPRPSAPAAPPQVLARSSGRPAPGPHSYTGFIRKLEQPLTLAEREYEYELAESRHDKTPIAFLTGGPVDLSSYRFRPVRLWAETIEARPGHPALLEVKGVGFIW